MMTMITRRGKRRRRIDGDDNNDNKKNKAINVHVLQNSKYYIHVLPSIGGNMMVSCLLPSHPMYKSIQKSLALHHS